MNQEQLIQEQLDYDLRIACREGKYDLAEYLIDKGANVNTKDMWGWTPLHFAAYCGRTGIAKLFIEKGALLNEKNKNGETPIYLAIRRGRTEVVNLLEQAMKDAA